MRILIYYHHGLGDCILLTPQLEYFYQQYSNVKIDLLCKKSVMSSHLFDDCPYINDIIVIKNPWHYDFRNQLKKNYEIFREKRKKYDKSYFIDHLYLKKNWSKVYTNSLACKIFEPIDIQPEIFIKEDVKKKASKYIQENYPNGFIFQHTDIEYHQVHNWNPGEWIANNLPNLPIFNSSKINVNLPPFQNINFTFYLLSKADYVILSSSVMAHAADAMKKDIDVLHYGKSDFYNLPVNKQIVKRLRVKNNFINVEEAYSHLRFPKKVNYFDLFFKYIGRYYSCLKYRIRSFIWRD